MTVEAERDLLHGVALFLAVPADLRLAILQEKRGKNHGHMDHFIRASKTGGVKL